MLLHLNTDPRDHSSCALTYDEQDRWMQATWQGYVDPLEALEGAETYLRYATPRPCAYLLNDNAQLRGPWFESLTWLLEIWVPQASRLGLRYVAHIVQADTHHDILTSSPQVALPFELQIFEDSDDARQWLRQMRDAYEAQQVPVA